MNRRGFIEHDELGENLELSGDSRHKVIQSYQLGEYILA